LAKAIFVLIFIMVGQSQKTIASDKKLPREMELPNKAANCSSNLLHLLFIKCSVFCVDNSADKQAEYRMGRKRGE